MVEYKGNVYQLNADIAGIALECIRWVHEVAPLKALSGLVSVVHKSARDIRLSDCRFGEFISADSVYCGYISTNKAELAGRLVRFLWPGMKRKIRPWMRPAAVIWFSALKEYLAGAFTSLYAKPDPTDIFASSAASPAAVKESVNAQIRALTKGDITLEEKVLSAPMYRALTELDQLAKEYKELKQIGN